MQWIRHLAQRLNQSRLARASATKSRGTRSTQRSSLRLEPLGPRLLLSATLDGSGVLHVDGTLNDDNIAVQEIDDAGIAKLRVTIGSYQEDFLRSAVEGLLIQGSLGSDAITVGPISGDLPDGVRIYGFLEVGSLLVGGSPYLPSVDALYDLLNGPE